MVSVQHITTQTCYPHSTSLPIPVSDQMGVCKGTAYIKAVPTYLRFPQIVRLGVCDIYLKRETERGGPDRKYREMIPKTRNQ